MANKKLLVNLDLDETLIFTDDMESEFQTERDDPDLFTNESECIYFRPGVHHFLKKLDDNKKIEIGIFTAGGEWYAKPIIERLFKDLNEPSYVFYRDRCTHQYNQHNDIYSLGGYRVIKDLKKVKRKTGYDYSRIVAVDDKMVYPRHRGNVLLIPEYKGQREDNFLNEIYKDIIYLQKQENVRDFLKDFRVKKIKLSNQLTYQ